MICQYEKQPRDKCSCPKSIFPLTVPSWARLPRQGIAGLMGKYALQAPAANFPQGCGADEQAGWLTLNGHLTLDRSLRLIVPWCPPLRNGLHNSSRFFRCLGGPNDECKAHGTVAGPQHLRDSQTALRQHLATPFPRSNQPYSLTSADTRCDQTLTFANRITKTDFSGDVSRGLCQSCE